MDQRTTPRARPTLLQQLCVCLLSICGCLSVYVPVCLLSFCLSVCLCVCFLFYLVTTKGAVCLDREAKKNTQHSEGEGGETNHL